MLEIVKRLKGAGFDDIQAEALTGVVRDLRESDRAALATKSDIERLEAKIESEIGRLEAKIGSESGRLEAKIDLRTAELKADIIRWVIGIGFAQSALMFALFRLFATAHP